MDTPVSCPEGAALVWVWGEGDVPWTHLTLQGLFALHNPGCAAPVFLWGLVHLPLPGFSTAKHRWNRMWFYFHFTDELCYMGGPKAQIHGAIYFLWKTSQWELNSFRPLNTLFVVRGLAECCRSQGASGGDQEFPHTPPSPHINNLPSQSSQL